VDLIDRVEVIRGPGSSLYGNNAVFGVINVITRRGQDYKGSEVSASYASFDTETGRISYGNRFTNGVELALSATLLESSGHDQLYYPEFRDVHRGLADQVDGTQLGSGFVSMSYRDSVWKEATRNEPRICQPQPISRRSMTPENRSLTSAALPI